MPQTATNLGQSLGELLGSAFDDSARIKGVNDGMRNAKALAEAQNERRRGEMMSEDGILSTALQSAGIVSSDMPKFKNYMNYGTVDAPEPPKLPAMPGVDPLLSGALQANRPTSPSFMSNKDADLLNTTQKEIKLPIQITPQQRAQYEYAMRNMGAIRQAMTLGDKNSKNAVASALTNLRASGAGTDDSTLAHLLLNNNPQYRATENGVLDQVSGAYNQTALGDSRIRENDAKASKQLAATPGNPHQAVRVEKSMPVQAMKMQEENIDAISTAQGIKTDLSSFLNQLDSGALNIGVLSNAMSSAKNFTGNSDEQSRNYQSFKATLEKLRNDSLRLNKGVQTDGDAQRAWNELLTNINDPKVVRQRLVEIQAINDRAVKIRMARNNNLRSNYGNPALDYSPYLNQESAIGGVAQQPEQMQQPHVVRTGMVNGRKVMQLSDGSIQFAE